MDPFRHWRRCSRPRSPPTIPQKHFAWGRPHPSAQESAGFAEALSDDGKISGRGGPLLRGSICGLMTTLGGIGHTLPYLISNFRTATSVALFVVVVELAAISWIRWRYMETSPLAATTQVAIGGALVFAAGWLIGSNGSAG